MVTEVRTSYPAGAEPWRAYRWTKTLTVKQTSTLTITQPKPARFSYLTSWPEPEAPERDVFGCVRVRTLTVMLQWMMSSWSPVTLNWQLSSSGFQSMILKRSWFGSKMDSRNFSSAFSPETDIFLYSSPGIRRRREPRERRTKEAEMRSWSAQEWSGGRTDRASRERLISSVWSVGLTRGSAAQCVRNVDVSAGSSLCVRLSGSCFLPLGFKDGGARGGPAVPAYTAARARARTGYNWAPETRFPVLKVFTSTHIK